MNSHKAVDVSEPFPIYQVTKNYLIYDIDVITHLRRQHHICGVLIGSLPQVPQQNVFLGIPLELMPEEVRLLVDTGVAYVVDDVTNHQRALQALSRQEKAAFLKTLRKEGKELAQSAAQLADQKRQEALTKSKEKTEAVRKGRLKSRGADMGTTVGEQGIAIDGYVQLPPDETSTSSVDANGVSTLTADLAAFSITPTASSPLINVRNQRARLPLPEVASYPLFAHLHSQNYFISPGLRFGCQYLVYPGDPLRFHSHFLAVAAGWDEEIDLIDIVAGGRLGTGVKKGFLIGGAYDNGASGRSTGKGTATSDSVRTFCIEWGGM